MRRLRSGLAHALLVCAACGGGGGSGGSPPADAVAQGTITAMGSVTVSGTPFDTVEAMLEGIGGPGNPAALAVGMQVTVEGSRSGDSGTADLVTFDDDLEGEVESVVDVVMGELAKLAILGQTVVLEEGVTLFEGTDFADILAEDVVEVSGLRDGDGVIHATWVRLVAMPGRVSLEGEVESLDATAGRFMIGTIEVRYDRTGVDTDLVSVPEGGLVEGDFVDVLGVAVDDDTVDTRDAMDPGVVELEERAFEGSRPDVQREGIVSEFVSVADFELDGQPVNAGRFGVDFEPGEPDGGLATTLADGDRIEVEGSVQDGVLVAEAVKLRAGEVRIEGALGDPMSVVDTAAGTFDLLDTATFEVDGATRFHDPLDPDFDGLEDLEIDDLLDVRGVDLGDVVRPTEINRVGSLAGVGARVRGRVEAFDGSDRTFTIVGVEIGTEPGMEGTDYQGFPAVSTESEFYTFLSACPSALLDVTSDDPDLHILAVADRIALADDDCTP